MKVKIEIDLSAEEARTFLGLPDLSSVHQAFLDQAKDKLGTAAGLVDVAPLVKTWTGLGGLAQDVVGSFLGAAMTAATTGKPSKPSDTTEASDKPGS
jgi:hypothetical protein